MKTGKHTIFYGWIIACCCMIMCTATSLCSSGMSTDLAAIKNTFGFTGAQTSLIITIRSVSAFLFTLLATKYFELLGVKKGMIVAMLFGIVAFVIFGFSGNNLWMYYVGSVFTGITYAYGLMLPSAILLRRWFNHSIGIALAIASCGTGMVNIVFTPIIQLLINNFGIRNAFFFQAAVMGLTAVLIAIIIVEYPENKGLSILGGENTGTDASGKQHNLTSLPVKWVIVLMVATIFVGMSSSPAVSHYTLHYTTAGIDAMEVAKALSVYGIVIMVSKIFLGKVIDRFGILISTVIYSSVCFIGFAGIALIDVIPTIPWMYVGLVITAASAIIQTLGYPNWISRLDLSHYTKSVSRCQLGYQIGVLVGSIIPGFIFDATGSYSGAYWIFGFAMLLSAVIVLVVFKKNT